MDVLSETRRQQKQQSAVLYQRQKVLAEVFRIEAEILVGVHADRRVEELLGKRQVVRLGMDGHDLFARQPRGLKAAVILRRGNPQVGREGFQPVLPRQQNGGHAASAPEVEHGLSRFQRIPRQHLLQQFGRVRPHDIFLEKRLVKRIGVLIVHF